MTRPWMLGLLLLVSSAACRSSAPSDLRLMVAAEWKDDPGSADEIGYWVTVDVGSPGRASSCSPVSTTLAVTIDDRPAQPVPLVVGDCVGAAAFAAGPFPLDQPDPLVVRVLDGAEPMGEATYDALFPGYPVNLISPTDGELRLGAAATLSLPAPLPAAAEPMAARWDWLDPPAGVPPFHVWSNAVLGPDRQVIAVTAPALTGRAALTVAVAFDRIVAAASCSGFASCNAWQSATAGPVAVDVIP